MASLDEKSRCEKGIMMWWGGHDIIATGIGHNNFVTVEREREQQHQHLGGAGSTFDGRRNRRRRGINNLLCFRVALESSLQGKRP